MCILESTAKIAVEISEPIQEFNEVAGSPKLVYLCLCVSYYFGPRLSAYSYMAACQVPLEAEPFKDHPHVHTKTSCKAHTGLH